MTAIDIYGKFTTQCVTDRTRYSVVDISEFEAGRDFAFW